jgi:chromosome segregation protein
MEEKERRVAELGAEAEQLEGSIESLTEQAEALTAQVDELSSKIAETEQLSANQEQEQQRLERTESVGRRKLQEYEAAHNKAVLDGQRCEDELRNLQERIESDLETISMSTDWPSQLPLDIDARLKSLPAMTEVPRGLEAEIKRLRNRVRRVGPVDLEAVGEYQEVADRHAFLIGQVEDLEKAAQSLRKVIAELDRLMEDKFVETFGKIAEEFGSFFTRLFNGGQANLSLTDPDNPLQSGVEILAQPPGRRRRSIAMLSGGERALTGVALTFSILRVCSTPFCLLDEVDARLDEVNVGRFGESLQELSENTQIVVITHNRGTVETADSIYGVTMGGDGASRVLSLRLEQIDEKAS